MFEDASKQSCEYFNNGWYCAESVLMAVAEYQAITCEYIPKMATGFCSGLSRSGGICGALSGAVLAISLVLGRDEASESVEQCYGATKELMNGFVEAFGAETCQALTSCHLGTEEGQARFRAENMHERCLGFVGEATRLALKSIANHPRIELSDAANIQSKASGKE